MTAGRDTKDTKDTKDIKDQGLRDRCYDFTNCFAQGRVSCADSS